MSGLIASATIERVVGLETIPHLTPRDSSIAGLESMLLGAHAEGIRNVLAVTGDPPEAGDYPGARGVYEVDSIGLSQMITRMNAGEDYNGREIDAPTSFFLGVAVNPAADDLDYELERFERKLEAGAQFAMTQVLFDLAYLERVPRAPRRLVPDPAPRGDLLRPELPARRAAAQRGAGDRRPRARAGSASATPERTPATRGSRSHASSLEASRERAAGVYVIPPFRQPHAALDLFCLARSARGRYRIEGRPISCTRSRQRAGCRRRATRRGRGLAGIP